MENNIELKAERVLDEALLQLADINKQLIIERALRGQLQEEVMMLREELDKLKIKK